MTYNNLHQLAASFPTEEDAYNTMMALIDADTGWEMRIGKRATDWIVLVNDNNILRPLKDEDIAKAGIPLF